MCLITSKQIDRSSESKPDTQFPSLLSGHKYESGQNWDYLFYMYDNCEPRTTYYSLPSGKRVGLWNQRTMVESLAIT